MADRALSLDPTHSWTQSAAAWVAFTGKDFDRAFRLSDRAMDLDPEDGNVLDFHALIALFSGNFKSARDAADPSRPRTQVNQRFANLNIYAAANFHLSEYAETIKSFKTAAEVGDPLSAPVLAFMAAAYHAMGEVREAKRKAKELSTTWPKFKADRVLRRIYRHPTRMGRSAKNSTLTRLSMYKIHFKKRTDLPPLKRQRMLLPPPVQLMTGDAATLRPPTLQLPVSLAFLSVDPESVPRPSYLQLPPEKLLV